VLHNDPFTTREFVTEVLRDVFGMDPAEAESLMLSIHRTGQDSVGPLPGAVARERIGEAASRARARGFPLRFTVAADAR
jgi:ATP-dependent Clp protease adaptor protein ClpS